MNNTLDDRLKQWRMSMALKHGLFTSELDELEDQLRTEVNANTGKPGHSSDVDPAEHLDRAISRLGEPGTLAGELKQVRRKNILILLIGWISFAALGIFGAYRMTPSGSLLIFVDYNAILLVLGCVWAGLMMTYHPRQIGQAFKLGLLRHPPNCYDELGEARGVLRRGRHLSWASALIAIAASAMFYLVQFGDNHALGQSLSLAIIGTLFAVCIAELFFASQLQLLNDRYEQIESASLG